jgi:hypothetical protein
LDIQTEPGRSGVWLLIFYDAESPLRSYSLPETSTQNDRITPQPGTSQASAILSPPFEEPRNAPTSTA